MGNATRRTIAGHRAAIFRITCIATMNLSSHDGGMAALIAAARQEGQLNVITLPGNWANYGTIMKDFTAKYGIKITDANPRVPARTSSTPKSRWTCRATPLPR